jgi:hypothetical protein
MTRYSAMTTNAFSVRGSSQPACLSGFLVTNEGKHKKVAINISFVVGGSVSFGSVCHFGSKVYVF